MQTESSFYITKEAKQLADAVDAFIFIVDSECNFIMINNAIENYLHIKSKELIGKTYADYFPIDDAKKYEEDNKDIIQNGTIKENIIEQIQVGSERRWVRINKAPFYNKHGEIIGVIGTGIDVTHEKNTEKELLESQSFLNEILETTSDGIIVLNTKFQYLYWNHAIEIISETSREDILGKKKKAWELFPHLEENGINILMHKAMNGEMVHKKGVPFQLKSGKTGFSDESYFPLYDLDGTIQGILGVIRDTTEEHIARKRMKLLADVANKFVVTNGDDLYELLAQTVHQLAGDSIVTINIIDDAHSLSIKHIVGLKEKTIQRINTIMGKKNLTSSFEEMHDEAIDAFFTGKLVKLDNGLYQACFNTIPKSICKTVEKLLGITSMYSIGLRRQDKIYGSVTIAMKGFQKEVKKEPIETIVNQASVVLEKRESFQKLERLTKNLEEEVNERTIKVQHLLDQKDAFIYQLGHDLKNPLGPLINLIPVLEKKANDSDCLEILAVLKRNVRYMTTLVNKTLKLARLDATEFQLSLKNVTLKSLIDEVVGTNQYLFDTKNMKVSILCDKHLDVVLDESQITEVLNSLLNNAVKYSHEHGHIKISTQQKHNEIIINIQDDGIGINNEYQQKIFDEYFKVDPARHDFDSSGLGLSICKRIIEKHGGNIWVESKGLEKGSVFSFSLPITQK